MLKSISHISDVASAYNKKILIEIQYSVLIKLNINYTLLKRRRFAYKAKRLSSNTRLNVSNKKKLKTLLTNN